MADFEILRQNKIVALVVMFLVIGAIVGAMEMLYGQSFVERFITDKEVELTCAYYGYNTPECVNARHSYFHNY